MPRHSLLLPNRLTTQPARPLPRDRSRTWYAPRIASHAPRWAVLFSVFAACSGWIANSTLADDPALSELESRFLSNVKQVTSQFTKAGEGYFSPDGTTIVYQAEPPGYPFYQIYTQRLGGGPPKLVSPGRGRTTCSYFSPDGQRLLFASSHEDPNLHATEEAERAQLEDDRRAGRRRRYAWAFDEQMDMYETDPHGKILRRLTKEAGYDAEGAYSRDGTKIAFCSTRDGDPDLYVMNADGTDVRQITNHPGYDGGPFLSPDGRWIIYRTDRKKAEHLQIHVIGIDGKGDTALTDNVGVNWGPYWHPTRPCLIWSGADHSDPSARPNYDLWIARYVVESGAFRIDPPVRVTDSPSADVLPVFSPDGAKLLWTSTRTADHSSQLFLGDFRWPDGTAP
ncbi:MAG: biopolymer transporter Tol [Planctomycetes bacterium]|nr:biopolymer transporter Tol [Planctomycetota bacterium]